MPDYGADRCIKKGSQIEAGLIFADLFAIVKTTEKLERAYVRDAISAKDYEPLCEKLIAQFRTLWETLRDMVWLPPVSYVLFRLPNWLVCKKMLCMQMPELGIGALSSCLCAMLAWRGGSTRRWQGSLVLLVRSCNCSQVPDVEKFMADYNMQCPMAAKRLIYSGMPATVEHGKPRCLSLATCSQPSVPDSLHAGGAMHVRHTARWHACIGL